MTSEEPGMSVSAPATKPPVQDSAVAMVSLRLRQRSSSERERARASLPLISVAPGETNRGAGHRRDAFLAAGKAEPFAGSRLHRDARQIEAGNFRNACAHGVAVLADLRPLADQRDVEMRDASATRRDAIDRVFQKLIGCRALPFGIAG